jgi:hypothetical protein
VWIFEIGFDEAALIDGKALVVLKEGGLPDDLGLDNFGPAIGLRPVAERSIR